MDSKFKPTAHVNGSASTHTSFVAAEPGGNGGGGETSVIALTQQLGGISLKPPSRTEQAKQNEKLLKAKNATSAAQQKFRREQEKNLKERATSAAISGDEQQLSLVIHEAERLAAAKVNDKSVSISVPVRIRIQQIIKRYNIITKLAERVILNADVTTLTDPVIIKELPFNAKTVYRMVDISYKPSAHHVTFEVQNGTLKLDAQKGRPNGKGSYSVDITLYAIEGNSVHLFVTLKTAAKVFPNEFASNSYDDEGRPDEFNPGAPFMTAVKKAFEHAMFPPNATPAPGFGHLMIKGSRYDDVTKGNVDDMFVSTDALMAVAATCNFSLLFQNLAAKGGMGDFALVNSVLNTYGAICVQILIARSKMAAAAGLREGASASTSAAASVNSAPNNDAEIRKLIEHNEKVDSELVKMEKKVSELTKESKKFEEAFGQQKGIAERNRDQITALNKEIEKIESAHQSVLNDKVKAENELKLLKEKIPAVEDSKREIVTTAAARVQILTSENGRLAAENASLKEQHKMDFERLSNEIAQHKATYDTMKREFYGVAQRHKQLVTEVTEKDAKITALESQLLVKKEADDAKDAEILKLKAQLLVVKTEPVVTALPSISASAGATTPAAAGGINSGTDGVSSSAQTKRRIVNQGTVDGDEFPFNGVPGNSNTKRFRVSTKKSPQIAKPKARSPVERKNDDAAVKAGEAARDALWGKATAAELAAAYQSAYNAVVNGTSFPAAVGAPTTAAAAAADPARL